MRCNLPYIECIPKIMAENVITSNDELLRNIKTLLWGPTVKEDVFKRWAQGNGVLSQILSAIFCIETSVQSYVRDYIGVMADQHYQP